MSDRMMTNLVSEIQSLRVSLEGLRVTLAMLVRTGEDHEARVRVLEGRHQRLAPVVSAALFLLGSLSTAVIGYWLGG